MPSRRLPFASSETPLHRLAAQRRASGVRLFDLTCANPTTVGLAYPEAELRDALAEGDWLRHQPDPRGLHSARAAIADRTGAAVDDLLLTASTSEAYALLLKLLCDPGDAVLAPTPAYPLLEHLVALEGVELVPFPLAWEGRWQLDVDALDHALARTPRARALLVVNPGNPTGTLLRASELAQLGERAAARGLALISDEVFGAYVWDDGAASSGTERIGCVAADAPCLAFSLDGLSKRCGLPQLKLSWIRAGGPLLARRAALAQLELIADAYLSVGAPVMAATGRLLDLGDGIRANILARVRANRAWLAQHVGTGGAATLLTAEGGWCQALRLPATLADDEFALELLAAHNVLVHPGYLFDFPDGWTCVVVSLLVPEHELRAGVEAILSLI
ncbi:MAG: pyridoxal phosphate-dependent aminotransferase [Myxococcales bacterium]|nr:pyridoxal phosphate-dependent aminotransferase [Myxococcales bacterium]